MDISCSHGSQEEYNKQYDVERKNDVRPSLQSDELIGKVL